MCGGVREFESLRAPETLPHRKISALQREIRQSERVHPDGAAPPSEALSAPVLRDHEQLTRQRETANSRQHCSPAVLADAAAARPLPAGLAILADMTNSEAITHSSIMPATNPSVSGPITKLHLTSIQNKQGVLQSHSQAPASARAGGGSSAGGPYSSTNHQTLKYEIAQPTVRTGSRRRKEDAARSRKSSVFYCAFSPPMDLINIVDIVATSAHTSADFMGACCLCGRPLESGIDIFMYRGDQAFCSNDCRYQQIMEDERRDSVLLPHPRTLPSGDCKNVRVGASPIPVILSVLS